MERILADMTEELLETQSWLGGKTWWGTAVLFWLVAWSLCSISLIVMAAVMSWHCARDLHDQQVEHLCAGVPEA